MAQQDVCSTHPKLTRRPAAHVSPRPAQIQFASITIALVSFFIPHDYDAINTNTGAAFNGTAAFPKNFVVGPRHGSTAPRQRSAH